MNLFDLNSKVAVITGGNGGIGLGIAKAMAQQGAQVVIAARDAEKTAQAITQLQALGLDAFGVHLDILSEESIAGLVEQSLARYRHIDILVNNAGINIAKRAEEFSADDWRQVMDTNLVGAYQACAAVYPHMKSAGGGKIINVSSLTAMFGTQRSLPYGASKSGLVQLTKSLALAWAGDNIQANAILPGWVETEMTSELRANADPEIKKIHNRITDRIPAGRWAKPEDIAGAAVFLASAAADYVTGAVLAVDGGYSAG
jgi:2-deoxy-D-gluconate 3-dehydrogenase